MKNSDNKNNYAITRCFSSSSSYIGVMIHYKFQLRRTAGCNNAQSKNLGANIANLIFEKIPGWK